MNKSRWLPTTLGLLVALAAGNGVVAGPGFPFVTATQADYAPGDTAVILGYEFAPGQRVTIKIVRPDGTIMDARGRKGNVDTVAANALGELVYSYPRLDKTGLYHVEALDPATVVKSRGKITGTILATTVFADNITTDLEMVGMPDAFVCTPPAEPRHGASDGLVDALAGRCLVGTVDVKATGNDNDVRGFTFDLVIDIKSNHQSPGNELLPFIDRLETVDVDGVADHDTGSAVAPDGTGSCVSPCFYTTAGNTVINAGDVITSLDGTKFEIGPVTSDPVSGEDVYPVTVSNTNPSALLGARFEYCARLNVNAGDADNGTDGFVTSDPETGGTEASPINVCKSPDETPPICEVSFIDSPCTGVDVFVQDPESGVESIAVVQVQNATVTTTPSPVPGPGGTYTPPETGPITVRACKDDLGASSNLALEITNGDGLITSCDPVDFTLVRAGGTPVDHRFRLGEREGYLRIENDGLDAITMDLNGHQLRFSVRGASGPDTFSLAESGISQYDLRAYLVRGENSVTISATGAPGGKARVSLYD